MNTRTQERRTSIRFADIARPLSAALFLFFSLSLTPVSAAAQKASTGGTTQTASATTTAARTPTDVVRAFYTAMREKRFREAFAMSVFKSAVDELSAEEYEELRPNFEKGGETVPVKLEISGEQISGDTATVFIRLVDAETGELKTDRVSLMRAGNAWIVGDPEVQQNVRKLGKKLFFEERIETNHREAESALKEIAKAQLVYSTRHSGMYGDLPALIGEKLMPQDALNPEWVGYRFRINIGKDGKSYTAGAEPTRYGRTGRLSFLMDASSIRSKDTGGKPLKASNK